MIVDKKRIQPLSRGIDQMVRIESHPRGLLLSVEDGATRNSLIRQLETRSGGNQILVSKGQLILPITLAGDVLDIVNSTQAHWDKDILHQARGQAAHRRMQQQARIEVARALEDPPFALDGYKHLPKLDPHQVAAVAAIAVPSLKGLALFDEQGTGKTIIALAAFDRLRTLDRLHRLMVVAPKSVVGAWQSDCKAFLGEAYCVATVTGASPNRKKIIQKPHDILLVSYDAAVREQGLIRMVIAAQPMAYMLVVDESYFVKNPKTARARMIGAIRPFCERAVVLCGTPAPNSSVDIVNQIDIADGGVAFAGRSISKDPGKAQATIAQALDHTIFLRRLKEDVFPNLPAKQFERVLVDLRPIQRKLYDEARDRLVLSIRSIDDHEFTRNLGSFLAKRAALLQICSNPSSIDPLYSENPAKLYALDVLLRELIETRKKKVVIWSFFRRSLQAIAERYGHYGLVRIDGSVPRIEDRLEAIDRFQNDESVRLFLGNAAAAGAGITLTASHHAIYESFSNQAAHYMQSVDRVHRRGQTKVVTSYILLARNSIETREFNAILKKERAGSQLLGDRYKDLITRERFLADLDHE